MRKTDETTGNTTGEKTKTFVLKSTYSHKSTFFIITRLKFYR